MCDVIVAMPDVTRNGRVLFGKNSDRPAKETQVLYFSPGGTRASGEEVQCSYVSVPEKSVVLATIGCRPYWCWGYETGMNEAGVIGGNAAIYTRAYHQKSNRRNPGLTGMDLLRLGLERGRSAEEALSVIVELLDEFGQWGSAVQGKDHDEGSYENSFLLADRKEAWVLETSGRRWVAERVVRGTRTVSNELTIRKNWAEACSDLEAHARNSGWWDPESEEFDFARVYGDHEHYSRQVSHIRWKRGNQLLERERGRIEATTLMTILRDHYEDTFLQGPQFHPFLPDFHTICMHDSPSGFTWGNTATSVVVELDPENPAPPLFWTAYLPPCTSLYTAIPFGEIRPETVGRAGNAGLSVWRPQDAPEDGFVESSMWWRIHRVVEEVRKNPLKRWQEVKELLCPIEVAHVNKIVGFRPGGGEGENTAIEKLVAEHIDDLFSALEKLEKRWNVI